MFKSAAHGCSSMVGKIETEASHSPENCSTDYKHVDVFDIWKLTYGDKGHIMCSTVERKKTSED